MAKSPISAFVDAHFHHFNAAALRDAAHAYKTHIADGGRMLVTLGGAMSTAEIGRSMAEMIRQGKIHAVCCTGANLEEDVFNLIAHEDYERVPAFRYATPEDDAALYARDLSRITDTCLPNKVVWGRLQEPILEAWKEADRTCMPRFPHEFLFDLLQNGHLSSLYSADPRHSWMLAAMEHEIPLFVPAWEDSSLGNLYAAACLRGDIARPGTVRSGTEAMLALADWYQTQSADSRMGFFQVGGGVSGDFPICVVPMLNEDVKRARVPKWAYFCQVGDSTMSYGSYSGAPPTEKISWGKLEADTPSFVIESDATIVVPLLFAYVLGW